MHSVASYAAAWIAFLGFVMLAGPVVEHIANAIG